MFLVHVIIYKILDFNLCTLLWNILILELLKINVFRFSPLRHMSHRKMLLTMSLVVLKRSQIKMLDCEVERLKSRIL